MIKISILFLLISIVNYALAQEEKTLDEYFKELDIEKLKYAKPEIVLNNQLKYEKFVQESLWSETPYRAVIKTNSTILDIVTGQEIFVEEPHFANAIRRKGEDKYIYFLDKQNGIRFRTDAINVKSIEADLDLDIRPKVYKTYAGPTEYNKSDKELKLQVMVNYLYEQTNNQYFAQVFSISGKGENIGGLLQISLPSIFILEPGLSLRFDTLKLENFSVENSQLSLGPMVRFNLTKNDDLITAIDFAFERSIYKKISDNEYLSNGMAIRSYLIFPGKVINLNVGVSVRREWIYSSGETSIDGDKRGAWSYGLNLGIGVNI